MLCSFDYGVLHDVRKVQDIQDDCCFPRSPVVASVYVSFLLQVSTSFFMDCQISIAKTFITK